MTPEEAKIARKHDTAALVHAMNQITLRGTGSLPLDDSLPQLESHSRPIVQDIEALVDELEATARERDEYQHLASTLENRAERAEAEAARAALHQILTLLVGIAEAALEPKERDH